MLSVNILAAIVITETQKAWWWWYCSNICSHCSILCLGKHKCMFGMLNQKNCKMKLLTGIYASCEEDRIPLFSWFYFRVKLHLCAWCFLLVACSQTAPDKWFTLQVNTPEEQTCENRKCVSLIKSVSNVNGNRNMTHIPAFLSCRKAGIFWASHELQFGTRICQSSINWIDYLS